MEASRKTFTVMFLMLTTLAAWSTTTKDQQQQQQHQHQQQHQQQQQNYIASVSAKDTELSMKEYFGAGNTPLHPFYGRIGRDTSSVKKYMTHLYKNTTRTLREVDVVNGTLIDTVVGFVHRGANLPRPNASDAEGSMFFDVGSWSDTCQVLRSDLRLYMSKSMKSVPDTFVQVHVYKIVGPFYEPITSRIINTTTSAWHDFNILEASQSWRKDESKNNGIQVICTTMDKQQRSMKECGLVDYLGESEKRPFLVTYYESGDDDEILAEQLPQHEDDEDDEEPPKAPEPKPVVRDRYRRYIDTLLNARRTFGKGRRKRVGNTTCSHHDLYIRFSDLGWHEWIFQPKGYHAGYCGGECPFPLSDNMNASNHAIIQSLVAMILPSGIPKPCCAPIKLSPYVVFFVDDFDNVVIKRYRNMVVRDCGCQ